MRHASLAAALALLVLPLLGCVGMGTYGEVRDERDRLAQRNELLEAENRTLGAERVDLLEGLEDVRIERAKLDRDVKRLRSESAELIANLKAREQELARQNAEVARLQGTYTALVTDLESEVAAGQIEIRQLREGLAVNVSDDILFQSGSAEVGRQGREVLRKVAKRLAKLPHRIQVEGHTDDLKIRGTLAQRFPSNWELAAARAASVVRIFEEVGVPGERLSLLSFAEFRPVVANDSTENRAHNRRIEIRLEPNRPEERGRQSGSGKGAARPGTGPRS